MTENMTIVAASARNLDTKELDLLEENRGDQWSYRSARKGVSKSGKGDSRSRGQILKGRVLWVLSREQWEAPGSCNGGGGVSG